MPLTQDQITQFQTHGYTAVPDFFDATEVKAMQAEARRWLDEGLLRNVATTGDGETYADTDKAANLQLCPLNPHSPLFRAMPFESKVTDAVGALIGDDFVLHLDQTFIKPAGHGLGTNWHQDNAYFKISDPLKGTAMWIAVDEATEANGTIRVIPDAFAEPLEHSRDPMSDHHIRCYPDESKAEVIELPAGGVAFFCYGTPHATGANHTDRDRCGVAFHFLHRDCAAEKQNIALGTALTGPRASGGKDEYGEVVAGTWAKHVEELVAK